MITKEELDAIAEGFAPVLRNLTEEIADLKKQLRDRPLPEKGDKGEPGPPGIGIKGDPGESIIGPPGPEGKPGINGKDAEPVDREAIITEVLTRIPVPKDGKDGKDGQPAKDIDEDILLQRIAEAVHKAIQHIPQPKDGKDGAPGKDATPIHPDTVALMVVNEVQKAVAAIPKAKDGEVGRDAAQIEILPAIDPAKSYPRGTYAHDKGGIVRFDGQAWQMIVRGIDHETEEEFEEGRRRIRKTVYTDGTVFERESRTSILLYRDIFKDGEEYYRGDVVTWGNQTYHCQRTTKAKPGTSDDWRLMVRKGGDGKDAISVTSNGSPVVKLK